MNVYTKSSEMTEINKLPKKNEKKYPKLFVKLERIDLRLESSEGKEINHKNKITFKKNIEKTHGTGKKEKVIPNSRASDYIKLARNKFQCAKCDFITEKLLYVINHHDANHSDGINKCPHCPFETKLKYYYNHHVRSHKRPETQKCEYCGKDIKWFSYKMHMKTHQRNNKTERKCDHCDYKSYNGANVTRHMLTHKDPTELEKFSCHQCGYITSSKDGLRSHITMVHMKQGKWKKCQYCDYATRRYGHLDRHMLGHSQQAVQCTVCSQFYVSQENLKIHMYRKHADESEKRYFYCELCPRDEQYKTIEKGNLARHMLTHKTLEEIELFSCHKCSYLGKSKTALRYHFIGKHMPEWQVNKCALCGYSTPFKSRFKMHQQDVHERPKSKKDKRRIKSPNSEGNDRDCDNNEKRFDGNDGWCESNNFVVGENGDALGTEDDADCEEKIKLKIDRIWTENKIIKKE